MRVYSRLFEIYNEVVPKPVDPQIVLNCHQGIYIPLDVVLSQFKTLVKDQWRQEDYQIVRKYLVNIFGESTIKDLEEM